MNEGNKCEEPNDKWLIYAQFSLLAKKLKKTTQAHKKLDSAKEKKV